MIADTVERVAEVRSGKRAKSRSPVTSLDTPCSGDLDEPLVQAASIGCSETNS